MMRIQPKTLGLLLALAAKPRGWHALPEFDLRPAPTNVAAWRRGVAGEARDAAGAGLVELRRVSAGLQMRLTEAGRRFARDHYGRVSRMMDLTPIVRMLDDGATPNTPPAAS